jgi:hypothetical protein
VGELADTYNGAGIEPGAGGGAAVESVKGGMGSAGREVAMRVELSVEDWQERFTEMLAVMDTEHLIRFRHRLGKVGCKRLVELLTLEIGRREG